MINSQDQYTVFCQRHPTRIPIFVQPWYLDAVCAEGGWNAAIIEEKDEVVAVLPYFLKRKFGFQYITMPPFVKFMGPLFAKEIDISEQHQLLEKLIAQLPKIDAFHQNFFYPITNWLPFYWAGYQQSTRYSYLLDLHNLDQVYENIHRKRRRYIEKAQENGIKVELSEDAAQCYAINKMSFDRQSLKIPYTFEQFRHLNEALAEHQARQIFFAKDAEGQIHSTVYLIRDARSSYFHLAGDDPNLRNSGASILLIWEVIRYTKEVLGLNTFDFEGSIIQNVEYIRRQFGAVQTPYFYVWKYNSLLFKWLQQLRK